MTDSSERSIPPTSNELIEQIRRAHASACPKPTENPAWTNCHVDRGILLAELDRQRAEIERLQRELKIKTDACEFHRNRGKQEAAELDRQRAEIERLTRERDEARSASVPGSAAVFAAVEAERDQLREALKRISEPEYNATVVHDGDTWVEWLQRIAKEALSGAPESASETGNDPGVILKELWSVCRVVFYPDMGDLRGDYPIEHAPGAGKDARALIEARLAERVLQRARTTQKAKGDQK